MQLSTITVMLSAFLAPSTGHCDSGTFFFLPPSSSSGLLLREEHVDYFLLLCDRGFSLSHWILPLGVAVASCVETHCNRELITVDQDNTTERCH